MTDTNVIKLAQPGTFSDSLTEILRNGARALLTQAVETEVADFLGRYANLKTEAGHQRVVRHGHLPERQIMTGIGAVTVRQPRVRDRGAADGERIWFSPTILPPYARRTKSLEMLIPILYLKGVSTGDFEEALGALLGKDGGLSASTIARLKEAWVDEHARWRVCQAVRLRLGRWHLRPGSARRRRAVPARDHRCHLARRSADSATNRREAADFEVPSPAMIGRSPLGSRTAFLSLRVDTLIFVRPTKAKSHTFRLRHEILSTPTAAYSSPTMFPICFV